MHCQKCHSKALKIAVGIPGVESVELAGKEKDQVVVIGDGIDSVELTRRLRKKVAHAELVSVGEAKKEQSKSSSAAAGHSPPCGYLLPPPPPYYNYCVVKESGDPMICTIM
ncbi:hypothetical protein PHJA_000017100 [Phtheirospermum japonicum]|uniref:HMA domain-containing protein n=1 Tax=Phtheirospermum japonicum TaxID=374723 RepID=A0A830AXL2_9LAMI|nr:hypothetical protein PHJA_000017100 [Phtheirospermum japonicum]